MVTPTILIIVFITGVMTWAAAFGGQLPKPFHTRKCQGKDWRIAFPQASKHDIREFLSLFVSAFAFNDQERLKLNPSDSIMTIYRALYPHKWMADGLEVETLAEEFEGKYGATFSTLWHENLTLGELFTHTNCAK